MKINRGDFIQKLGVLLPVVNEDSNIFFLENGFAVLTSTFFGFTSTNILDGITGSTRFNELYKIICKIKQEEFDIRFTDTAIKIKAGKLKSQLVFEKDISEHQTNILEIGVLEQKKWNSLPDDFTEGVALCLKSVKRRSEKTLDFISVEDRYIKLTNNKQLSVFKTKTPFGDMAIARNDCNILIKLKAQKYHLKEGWLYLKNKSGRFAVLLLTKDSFLTMKEVRKFLQFEGVEITIPEAVKASLSRVDIFSKKEGEDSNFIDVSIFKNEIVLRGENEIGMVVDKIKYDAEQEITFSINPDMFAYILEYTDKIKIGEKSAHLHHGNLDHAVVLYRRERK